MITIETAHTAEEFAQVLALPGVGFRDVDDQALLATARQWRKLPLENHPLRGEALLGLEFELRQRGLLTNVDQEG